MCHHKSRICKEHERQDMIYSLTPYNGEVSIAFWHKCTLYVKINDESIIVCWCFSILKNQEILGKLLIGRNLKCSVLIGQEHFTTRSATA